MAAEVKFISAIVVIGPPVRFDASTDAKFSLARQLNAAKSTSGPELWILICLCDSEVGARLIEAGHRVPEIVILGQRGSNQLLELLGLQDFEPFEVRNGLPKLTRSVLSVMSGLRA